jgi:hypothetical protein
MRRYKGKFDGFEKRKKETKSSEKERSREDRKRIERESKENRKRESACVREQVNGETEYQREEAQKVITSHVRSVVVSILVKCRK